MSRPNVGPDVDVAVLGGGPAGTATALALCQRGFSATVIEKSGYENLRVGETLPPRIRTLLGGLEVWTQFLAENCLPAPGIHSVWGRDEPHNNDFLFNPYGAGWHVDRGRFDAMLARCAEEAGATVHRNAALTSCSEDESGHWRMEIAAATGRLSLRAKFVVDATGRSSIFARARGVRRILYDRLIGVLAFATKNAAAGPSNGCTIIEAGEQGWWYSAILPSDRAVVAYMTDSDLYGRAGRAQGNDWLAQLQQTVCVQAAVKSHALENRSHIVPGNTSCLETASGKNWLAVGDAAMAFDPLSGQGVYKALQSAIMAAEALRAHASGNATALHDYSLSMKQDFAAYLRIRQSVYEREQRWSHEPFWQRRHSYAMAIPRT